MTVAHVYTVAFQGIEAREVDVQVHIGEGGGAGGVFNIVGLADKAVAESRERVRAALSAIGLALPFQRITVNLAPADLPKEGSHYDLPIALGLLAAMGVLPASELANYVALGELSLDAQVTAVAGVLPAALAASEQARGLICPAACGPGSGLGRRSGDHRRPVADRHRQSHEGRAGAEPARGQAGRGSRRHSRSASDVKGQETAKRALEDRRGRRPQHADDRPARRRQIDAGRAPARRAAAARRARGAGAFHGAVAGRRTGGRRDLAQASLPQRRIIRPRCRRWSAAGCKRQAGRGESRASGCAVPRRIAGVPARGSGFACASRSRAAKRWSRAPMRMCAIRRGSSWWRR